jgi:K+:H+ antiporter
LPVEQASAHKTELLLFFTLVQLCIIVLAARLCGNLAVRWNNSRAVGEIIAGILLGIMMNTRALMELIVINIGYDLAVIPQSVFTMLVIMAIVSTVITTPALKRWLNVRRVAELEQGRAA